MAEPGADLEQIGEQSKELEFLLFITGDMKETFSLYAEALMVHIV